MLRAVHKMNEFKKYHPAVCFFYLVFVISFSMFLMHPVCLAINVLCSFLLSLFSKKLGGMKYAAVLAVMTAAANPLFNHEGMTVLWYFKSGNPFTLQSAVYGLAAGGMLAAVLMYFSFLNEVMTSDKIIYLFGKTAPSLALILSMTLGFVPRIRRQFSKTADAQKCLNRGTGGKIKSSVNLLSAVITWSLENAAETAVSMKSRGFGLHGRTSYSNIRFEKRDGVFLAVCAVLCTYVIIGISRGCFHFSYFPDFKCSKFSAYMVSVFFAYALFCGMPLIAEVAEELRWRKLKQKI